MRLALLHGLARSSRSMSTLAEALERGGHRAHLVDYGSRRAPLATIAVEVAEQLKTLGLADGGDDVGFVCHSMGGLVLRALPLALAGFACGRSVLLGSPVGGSLLAERLEARQPLRYFFGPALEDLTPARVAFLPKVPGAFGTVAGTRWSPLLPGAWLLRAFAPGRPSDSTVLVDETRSPDAADHVEVNVAHTFLARDAAVHRHVLRFLERGRFD